MSLRLIVVVGCLLLPATLFAQPTATLSAPAPASAPSSGSSSTPMPAVAPSLNVTMVGIGALMSNLLNEQVLADPAAALRQLDQLEKRFRETEAHAGERGPAFRISWNTLLEQIDRSRDAVDAGTATPDTLRNLVHGIASACAGCHTQDGKTQALSFGKLAAPGKDPLQQARFHFITRNYAEALKLYDAFLDAQPQLSWNGPVLDALEGELTIFAQIYRDPNRAIKHLKKRLDRSGALMSKGVRQDIQAWIKGFEEVRKAKLKARDCPLDDLEAYAGKFILPHAGEPIVIAEQDKVSYLWIRGLLHTYIQAHPEDARMPDLLYWLAISDRVLDYNFYYSLADLYLRECIVRYPLSDTAEQCYEEYERYVELAYSGSGGVHVPAEVQDELIRLRETIDAARAAVEVPAMVP